MSLEIYDAQGRALTEERPLVTEHDGSQGEAVDQPLTLRNGAPDYIYRRVVIESEERNEGVKVLVARTREELDSGAMLMRVPDLAPQEAKEFWLRVQVGAGSPEGLVKGGALRIQALRFRVMPGV